MASIATTVLLRLLIQVWFESWVGLAPIFYLEFQRHLLAPRC